MGPCACFEGLRLVLNGLPDKYGPQLGPWQIALTR